jgi:hypothetical protein
VQRLQSDEDISGLLDPYDALVRRLAPDAIQSAARRYLDRANYARFILLPESNPSP